MARPGLDRGVKFRNLCRLLGAARPHARGYLELLWEVVYENGNPFLGDAIAVEAAAEYPGEPGRLCKALLICGGAGRAGFIEPVPGSPPGPDQLYQVHDLLDHAPEYVRKRKLRDDLRRERAAGRTAGPADSGGQRQTTADNGGQCPPLADNGCQRQDSQHPTPLLGEVSPKNPSCRQEPTAGPEPKEFLTAWNQVPGFVRVRAFAGGRLRYFRARVRDATWAASWRDALTRAARLPFCLGRNDRGWRATVDWFLRPDTVTRILEGVYDGLGGKGGAPRESEADRRARLDREKRQRDAEAVAGAAAAVPLADVARRLKERR